MNYPKLRTLLESVIAGHFDSDFDHIFAHVHCMSRPRVYAILNAIVSSMEAGELYVEIGTYQGGSMIAALQENDAEAIGVDSFGEFKETNSFDVTLNNFVKFGIAPRASLKNMTYQDFFADAPNGFKIQVYNYDGEHGYEPQLAGMEAAWRFLVPGALILIDDYTYPEVSLAVNQFICNHLNEVKPLFILDPIESTDETWWNGCVILRKIR